MMDELAEGLEIRIWRGRGRYLNGTHMAHAMPCGKFNDWDYLCPSLSLAAVTGLDCIILDHRSQTAAPLAAKSSTHTPREE